MACPKIPLLRDQWNAWFIFARDFREDFDQDIPLDADRVESFVKASFGFDRTDIHDIKIRKAEDFVDAFDKLDRAKVIWRAEECDPIPAFDKPGKFNHWVVEFVVRGIDFEMAYTDTHRSNAGGAIILNRVMEQSPSKVVPVEPPDFLERITKDLKSGIEAATTFYAVLAVVAVVVAVVVITKD